ncbi:hypothetical protein K435DRAFT_53131 [Dendrothele bispora CBS 962.96]|uniref:Uncharacterized protein n=1 Tax=Dendrothele bispora (strain CBS 962.96) TaxID=1314807 RepID=A0A4S8KS78_DENBC|nr:hypothetical protein K435DRAFT_53131 [Dendrothele bispora CBS 962.96]
MSRCVPKSTKDPPSLVSDFPQRPFDRKLHNQHLSAAHLTPSPLSDDTSRTTEHEEVNCSLLDRATTLKAEVKFLRTDSYSHRNSPSSETYLNSNPKMSSPIMRASKSSKNTFTPVAANSKKFRSQAERGGMKRGGQDYEKKRKKIAALTKDLFSRYPDFPPPSYSEALSQSSTSSTSSALPNRRSISISPHNLPPAAPSSPRLIKHPFYAEMAEWSKQLKIPVLDPTEGVSKHKRPTTSVASPVVHLTKTLPNTQLTDHGACRNGRTWSGNGNALDPQNNSSMTTTDPSDSPSITTKHGKSSSRDSWSSLALPHSFIDVLLQKIRTAIDSGELRFPAFGEALLEPTSLQALQIADSETSISDIGLDGSVTYRRKRHLLPGDWGGDWGGLTNYWNRVWREYRLKLVFAPS